MCFQTRLSKPLVMSIVRASEFSIIRDRAREPHGSVVQLLGFFFLLVRRKRESQWEKQGPVFHSLNVQSFSNDPWWCFYLFSFWKNFEMLRCTQNEKKKIARRKGHRHLIGCRSFFLFCFDIPGSNSVCCRLSHKASKSGSCSAVLPPAPNDSRSTY